MIGLKLKAGALQLTLFIIVIIALLLTAFVLIVNIHKRFDVQSKLVIATVEQTNKGIAYALRTDFKDQAVLENIENDYTKTTLSKDYWGVFEKVIATSTVKKNRLQKIALIGSKQPEFNRTALYIEDNQKPLVIVGNTFIKGMAFLPKRGVKAGTIAGESYYGSQLIYGPTRPSSNLPKLNANSLTYLKKIKSISNNFNTNALIDITKNSVHENSFLAPTKTLFSNAPLNLNSISITGNIMIVSKIKITVEANALLKDVILVAPEVEIKSAVKGAFQVIASKNISVGRNVSLNYPSALVLLNDKAIEKKINNKGKGYSITINENSVVKGILLSITANKTSNFISQIAIAEKAAIFGEVYCNGNIELEGEVKGSVFTSNFIANQSGSIYQNHLYNAKININALTEQYSGLLFNNSKKKVVKWLY